jgi:transposase
MTVWVLTWVGGQTRGSDANASGGSPHNAGSNTKLPAGVQTRSRSVGSFLTRHKSVAQIANEPGVSDNSLRSWVTQFELDQGEREGLSTEEREELRKLRKENKILRQGREILGKAAASLAKEGGIR